jgi:hypothetical protein
VNLCFIRSEIERMRIQIKRQQREILALRRVCGRVDALFARVIKFVDRLGDFA